MGEEKWIGKKNTNRCQNASFGTYQKKLTPWISENIIVFLLLYLLLVLVGGEPPFFDPPEEIQFAFRHRIFKCTPSGVGSAENEPARAIPLSWRLWI